MNKKLTNIIKIFLILIILLVIATPLLSSISIFNELNKVFENKLIYILCITIPFLILFIIELTIILKEQKRKQLANMMNLKLEELNKVKDNKELSNTIENTIKSQIKEIDAAKKDYKKINELERTIQIPLSEIQLGLNTLNEKNKTNNQNEEDGELDNTLILFDNKDIKEEIQEELSLKKEKVKNNIFTKDVENNEENKGLSTAPVENSKENQDLSTKVVDKKEKNVEKSSEIVENEESKDNNSTDTVNNKKEEKIQE